MARTPKQLLIFFAILATAIGLRVVGISFSPAGLSHDELDYVLTARSLVTTGSDLSGNWKPWSLTPAVTETRLAELMPFLIAPAMIISPPSLATARIMPIFISTLGVFAFAWLVLTSTKRKDLALIAAAVWAISPWSLVFSHRVFEAQFAVVFLLISAASLFESAAHTTIKKLFFQILCILSFAVAFYTYHGFKLFLIPWLIALTWSYFRTHAFKKNSADHGWRVFAIILSVGVILTATFAVRMSSLAGQRQQELLPLNTAFLTKQVQTERQQGLQIKIAKAVRNKPTVFLQESSNRYLTALNPASWFVTGTDGSAALTLPGHGYFYTLDLVLGIFGWWWWKKRYPRIAEMIVIFLLISPIPASLHIGFSYIFRAAWLVPTWLLAVTGAGGWLLELYQQKKQRLTVWGIAAFYLGSVLMFLPVIWVRIPIVSADQVSLGERLVTHFRKLNHTLPGTIITNTSSPYHLLRADLFYNQKVTAQVIKENRLLFDPAATLIHWDGWVLTSDCQIAAEALTKQKLASQLVILETGVIERCKLQLPIRTTSLNIASPIDSRSYFTIVGQDMCPENLKPFIAIQTASELEIESLGKEDFCQNWMTRQLVTP